MTVVKVCGVTTYEDAHQAASAGADMLGLNFYPPSPRYLLPEAAQAIVERLRAALGSRCPVLVGVFVNEPSEAVRAVVQRVGLDFAQLSGDESPEALRDLSGLAFKAVQPADLAQALSMSQAYGSLGPQDERAPSLLLDAHHPGLRGGTGAQVSAEIALALRQAVSRLMLAGGLKPDNVAERVRAVQPWGVDVASGVEGETPGRKDSQKVRDFVVHAKV
ncbi:MAG: phosphoribosylanthranilate isomerase [Anaerolineae bacterium]|nr:phosphoribosylanthranilate isomerase [Anaerolineae bacterium]MDW8173114.1 phosphoribosylanthranilate isomerase [Anaerolineae bacterium]